MRNRCTLSAAALALLLPAGPGAFATGAPVATVAPGTVVRWPGPELVSCEMAGRRWQPLDGACWYAIDLEKKGTLELVRRSSGGVASRTVKVGAYPYPTQELKVEEKYVAPSAADLERIERDRKRAAAAFALETPRRFALPLGAPMEPLPGAGRFGARRVFNGEPRSPHGGADFPAKAGTEVRAAADGRVVLAEGQFFAGNAVFVDHGDGLVSMTFHLSEILVKEGDEVKKGDLLGKVGATGRVTGPHLHFALRWHGARVDPAILLELPGAPAPTEIR